MENKHECYIGLWYYAEGAEMKTLREILEAIARHNAKFEWDETSKRIWEELGAVRYSFNDLFDLRRNRLPLCRFNYCPVCGAKIDWKEIKQKCQSKEASITKDNR